MIIKNMYARVLAGVFWIAIGSALLKIYADKDKDTIWGSLYRAGKEITRDKQVGLDQGKIYLILGCLAVIGGVIAILFGFRATMVGR